MTPSEGYLLDNTVYPIGAAAKNYTVEYNTTASDVTEQIIKAESLSSNTPTTAKPNLKRRRSERSLRFS